MKEDNRERYMSLEDTTGWVFHRKKCEKIHDMMATEYKDMLLENGIATERGSHLYVNDKEVHIIIRYEGMFIA